LRDQRQRGEAPNHAELRIEAEAEARVDANFVLAPDEQERSGGGGSLTIAMRDLRQRNGSIRTAVSTAAWSQKQRRRTNGRRRRGRRQEQRGSAVRRTPAALGNA